MRENIHEYLKTYTKSFKECAPNEIDFAIFSIMSYYFYDIFDFKETIFIDDLNDFTKTNDLLKERVKDKNTLLLIDEITSNPRFKKVIIKDYLEINDAEKLIQFGVVSFILPTKDLIISFRGTDVTYFGWREDFNMLFKKTVPSQLEAQNYLKKYSKYKNNIYLCGHSKGGNLAIYSYIKARKSLKNKIKNIYVYDAPGLNKIDTTKLKENGLIKKFIPQKSAVGLCFDTKDYCNIVKSDGNMIENHNLYMWEVKNNSFVHLKALDARIRKATETYIDFVYTSTDEKERKHLVNFLFDFLKQITMNSNYELKFNYIEAIPLFKEKLSSLSKEEKKKAKPLVTQALFLMIKGLI